MVVFYFFISVFGIFDVRPKKNRVSLIVEYNFKLNEKKNHISFTHNPLKPGYEAVTCKTDLETEQIKNEYYVDELLVKRYKRTKLFRTLFILLMAAAFIAMVALLILA